MISIFSKLKHELEHQHDAALATIIAQEGSSPRGAGTQMLIKENGETVGTVGGGIIEKDCRDIAVTCIKDKRSLVKEYSLTEDGKLSIGMVCGGNVTIHIQYIDSSLALWKELTEKIITRYSEKKKCFLILNLTGSAPALTDKNGKILTGALYESFPVPEDEACFKSELCFYMLFAPKDRALVFGAGHCAYALVPFLDRIGFRVTLMDNRPELATQERFPDAEKVICGDYLKLNEYIDVQPDDYCVVMTHGHKFDIEIEAQILKNPPYYVGVVGSKRKKAYVNAKLKEAGISEEAIDKVHTPVGTDIKAVTPEEIAISIAGEMIYERALKREKA